MSNSALYRHNSISRDKLSAVNWFVPRCPTDKRGLVDALGGLCVGASDIKEAARILKYEYSISATSNSIKDWTHVPRMHGKTRGLALRALPTGTHNTREWPRLSRMHAYAPTSIQTASQFDYTPHVYTPTASVPTTSQFDCIPHVYTPHMYTPTVCIQTGEYRHAVVSQCEEPCTAISVEQQWWEASYGKRYELPIFSSPGTSPLDRVLNTMIDATRRAQEWRHRIIEYRKDTVERKKRRIYDLDRMTLADKISLEDVTRAAAYNAIHTIDNSRICSDTRRKAFIEAHATTDAESNVRMAIVKEKNAKERLTDTERHNTEVKAADAEENAASISAWQAAKYAVQMFEFNYTIYRDEYKEFDLERINIKAENEILNRRRDNIRGTGPYSVKAQAQDPSHTADMKYFERECLNMVNRETANDRKRHLLHTVYDLLSRTLRIMLHPRPPVFYSENMFSYLFLVNLPETFPCEQNRGKHPRYVSS